MFYLRMHIREAYIAEVSDRYESQYTRVGPWENKTENNSVRCCRLENNLLLRVLEKWLHI